MPTATSVAFRLFNVNRHLTFAELNDIFGWRTDGVIGPTDKYPREFNESAFWRSITGLPSYNARHTNWLFPNPGDALALEDNPEEPPSYPPDFIDRCTAFETRFSILEGQVSDIQDRVTNIEDMLSSVYEWHVKQNHFPDSRWQH
ncbi:hypothetical protein L6452_31734 [Arctium lappa]|uniref:Uncharacterized protein n=1 Tax=Arctium lappa TaxID=4217 RepID=A0ACB8Z3H8_ARCLA|nr:hypothetical protein L6452_31734 [Arctium lappa]